MVKRVQVAVVDDEEQVRKALRRLLRATGLDAVTFASGSLFLESLKTNAPDCVVLDLHMPGMSGLDVLKQMMDSGARLPTVVITAYDEPGWHEECLAAGASACLRKPLDEKILLDSIAAAMGAANGA